MMYKNRLPGINIGRFIIMLSLALVFAAHAREALFIGLTDGRGEPVQPNMEQAIRHEFSTNRSFRLIGETETQRYLRELERIGRGRTEGFVLASAQLADSVIIIRGVVRDLSLTIGRSMLAWGKINARMTVEFYFNEVNGPAVYQGEFRAQASKRKDLLLFRSAPKIVHITAADRSELIGRMQSQIIKELSEFTTLFFNSLATGPIHRRDADTPNADTPPDEFPGRTGIDDRR